MKRFLTYCITPILALFIVVEMFFSPKEALAAQVLLSSIEATIENTGLEQSAFENLASCGKTPVFPSGGAGQGGAYIPPFIDQPTGKTPYRGISQPISPVSSLTSVWFCDKQEVENTLKSGNQWHNPWAGQRSLTSAERGLVWALGNFFSVIASIALWIIWALSRFLEPLLGVGSFITNPMVRMGWPFVQGIANLGFLLAILFIAFATTLQLDSFSPQKTLPRLLVAALLINFSLILTGLLIDISRLAMAAMVTVLPGGTSINNLGFSLLEASDLVKINFNLQTFQANGYATFQGKTNAWSTVASIAQAMVLMWGLAAGFIILIFGLVARYIMLILLLIVSPLAFLAIALPNTSGLAMKWWSSFIKYVLYGPIAVFVLVLTVAASSALGNRNLLNQANTGFLENILNLFLVIAMMIAAATAGNKLGIMGSGAALSFVNKQGQRLRSGATYIPRTVGGTVSKAAKEQIGGAKKGITNYALTRMGFDPSAKKTVAQKFIEKRLPPLTSDQRTAAATSKRDVSAAVSLGAAHGAANVRTPSLLPNQLQQKHVVQNMNEQEIRFLVESAHTTADQKEALLSNPEAIKKLQSTQQGRDLIQDVLVVRDTNSDRPTNIGTDAQKTQAATENAIGKRNQALVKAMMRGFEKLDNPPA